jgi:hypothetical protein
LADLWYFAVIAIQIRAGHEHLKAFSLLTADRPAECATGAMATQSGVRREMENFPSEI